jgi:hypothetical protein
MASRTFYVASRLSVQEVITGTPSPTLYESDTLFARLAILVNHLLQNFPLAPFVVSIDAEQRLRSRVHGLIGVRQD